MDMKAMGSQIRHNAGRSWLADGLGASWAELTQDGHLSRGEGRGLFERARARMLCASHGGV